MASDPQDIASVNVKIDRGYGKKSSIDHRYTSQPVCPWCGATDHDWWDGGGFQADGDEADQECGTCEKPYRTTVHYDVDFCTEKRDLAEEKRVITANRERAETRRLERLAGVEALPPGTRVKVIRAIYRGSLGKTGTVANEEITRHNPHVHVLLDDAKSTRPSLFDPDDLERME